MSIVWSGERPDLEVGHFRQPCFLWEVSHSFRALLVKEQLQRGLAACLGPPITL